MTQRTDRALASHGGARRVSKGKTSQVCQGVNCAQTTVSLSKRLGTHALEMRPTRSHYACPRKSHGYMEGFHKLWHPREQ
eukprot:5705560-Amphidinium_carterae.3